MSLRVEALKTILSNKILKEQYLTHLERRSFGGRVGASTSSMTLVALRDLLENAPPNLSFQVMPKLPAVAISDLVKFGSPVMVIQNGIPISSPPGSVPFPDHWWNILNSCQGLPRAIKAVGRVSVISGNGTVNRPIGTAWFIRSNVLVTNKHVASSFAYSNGDFCFRTETGRSNVLGSTIDLLREQGSPENNLELKVNRVIYMDAILDLAFLEVESQATNPEPLELDLTAIVEDNAAVVGYPMYDGGVTLNLCNMFFDGCYGFKKIACGRILALSGNRISHSCPTLFGNSGSPLLSLATGNVIGIHYSGEQLVSNYAIPAEKIQKILIDNSF
jgi:V8-like Glu-specific endopeptidase